MLKGTLICPLGGDYLLCPIDAEDRYNTLLQSADEMERKGLITRLEWRKLAQQAGTLFASTAECMRDAK